MDFARGLDEVEGVHGIELADLLRGQIGAADEEAVEQDAGVEDHLRDGGDDLFSVPAGEHEEGGAEMGAKFVEEIAEGIPRHPPDGDDRAFFEADAGGVCERDVDGFLFDGSWYGHDGKGAGSYELGAGSQWSGGEGAVKVG